MGKLAKRCLNCGNPVKGNFCGHCGQSANTKRLAPPIIIEELQHSFLHIHKSILFTLKVLLIKPQMGITEYLDGKRKKYVSPIQYLFILAAFYSLTVHFFNVYPDSEINKSQLVNSDLAFIYHLFYDYYSLWLLVTVPAFALSSYLFFKRSGYNYMEHLAINAYITGTKIFISLFFYPFFYFAHSVTVYNLTVTMALIYNLAALALLFKKSSWTGAIIKAILSIVLVITTMSVLAMIYKIAVALLSLNSGI